MPAKKRCAYEGCRRKLKGMFKMVACKCTKFYCEDHFASSSHACTFDYQNNFKETLNTDKVEFAKMEKL